MYAPIPECYFFPIVRALMRQAIVAASSTRYTRDASYASIRLVHISRSQAFIITDLYVALPLRVHHKSAVYMILPW